MRATKTVVIDIFRTSIAVVVGIMRWSIALLRWTVIVLRKAIGILGRTVAVLRQAILVLGRTVAITDSVIILNTPIVALSAWRAGRTLIGSSRSSPGWPVVHLTWFRCWSVQGDKASTG